MAIYNLTVALVLGCLLVVMILAPFLFEWRVALISFVAIPVLADRRCWCSTFTRDDQHHDPGRLVIALGAVVDDAIIDVENIVRRLRQHRLFGSDRIGRIGGPGGLAGDPQPDRLRDPDHRAPPPSRSSSWRG